MKGKLLILGKPSKNGIVFSENCKITYPEKIPVTLGFNQNNPEMILGSAKISREENVLLCDCDIPNIDDSRVQALMVNEGLYVGGYYNRVFRDKNTVNSANLISMAVLHETDSADDELRIMKKEKSND